VNFEKLTKFFFSKLSEKLLFYLNPNFVAVTLLPFLIEKINIYAVFIEFEERKGVF
jgi:hypothetical protein